MTPHTHMCIAKNHQLLCFHAGTSLSLLGCSKPSCAVCLCMCGWMAASVRVRVLTMSATRVLLNRVSYSNTMPRGRGNVTTTSSLGTLSTRSKTNVLHGNGHLTRCLRRRAAYRDWHKNRNRIACHGQVRIVQGRALPCMVVPRILRAYMCYPWTHTARTWAVCR